MSLCGRHQSTRQLTNERVQYRGGADNSTTVCSCLKKGVCELLGVALMPLSRSECSPHIHGADQVNRR